MPKEILSDPPPVRGYGALRRVTIGKSSKDGEVYYFVRRGMRVLFRGSEEECQVFVDRGMKVAPKKKKATKKKAAAKK